MKLYKDMNDNLFGFESDGSQDYLISDGLILISEEEANTIKDKQVAAYVAANPVPKPTKEQLLAELQSIAAKIEALNDD